MTPRVQGKPPTGGAPSPILERQPSGTIAIRIAIVDDQAKMRSAISALLAGEAGLEVVGEADTVEAAHELVATLAPDVLLLDLGLGQESSLPAIPDLLAARRGLAVIVLTMHDEPALRRSALDSGASAYVLKDDPPATLIETIHATRGL